MKKLFSILFLVLLVNLVTAQVSKTINLTTAGTLSNLLTSGEKTSVTDLTITGSIDASDFKCLLMEVTSLTSLDLSGATIQAYSGIGGSSMDGLSVNQMNTMPPFAFYDGGGTAKRTLTSIIFPSSLVSIGDDAFYWSGLINVTIPNSVTSIGGMAFNACSDLSTLTIGSSVTSMGGGAFHACSNLTTIKSLNPIPPVLGNDCFADDSPTMIYVPIGTIGAYKAAPGWSAFTNYQEMASNVVSGINQLGENNKINIYPNPVKNDFKIDFEGGSTFEMLNLMGQVVYNGDLVKNTIVQTSHLSSGVYVIKFKTGKSFEYKKIIKD